MKKAFTLAEVLIVLAIMGIVVVLTSSATIISMPKKDVVIFKKTYATINKAIFEVANDKFLYPNVDDNLPIFSQPNKVASGISSSATIDEKNEYDELKNQIRALLEIDDSLIDINEKNFFCYAVASKFSLMEPPVCKTSCDTDSQNLKPNFITQDGTKFFGLCGQFSPVQDDNQWHPIYIYVEAAKNDALYGLTVKEDNIEHLYKTNFNKIAAPGGRDENTSTPLYRVYINAKGQILVNDEPEKTLISKVNKND